MLYLGGLREMFPTKWSVGLFFLYIFFFVNQGLLVTRSQDSNNNYNYSTAVAVLLCDAIKLMVCVIGYSFKHNCCKVLYEAKTHLKVLILYFVPSGLYCIYNNLSYINLSTFDPTTYFLALQLRVVVTGVVFQVIFKKKLSGKQWLSLLLLTAGCMVKEVNFGDVPESGAHEALGKQLDLAFSGSSLLLFIQVLCSCFAGVYNEYLLKSNSQDLDLYVQNIFQYFDSIVCNILMIFLQGDFSTLFEKGTYQPFSNREVFLVVLNNAAIGIVTSFFLRYLNSILKTFASGFELAFTAVLSYFLFSIPIYINTILAIFTVTLATLIYSQNPVDNSKAVGKEDKERLIDKLDV